MSQEPMLESTANHSDNAVDSSSLDDEVKGDKDQQVISKNDATPSPRFVNDHSDAGLAPNTGHGCRTPTTDVTSTQPPHHTVLKNPQTGTGTEKNRAKGSVQIREPPVSEKRGYKIVKIEQKHGLLHRAIPVMPLALAIICCLLNILLPGTGTLISAFTVFFCGITTRMSRPVHAMALNIVSGLLQMATFLLIVGWIWSILWGMTFVQLALSAKEDAAVLAAGGLPYYVRRHSSVE